MKYKYESSLDRPGNKIVNCNQKQVDIKRKVFYNKTRG